MKYLHLGFFICLMVLLSLGQLQRLTIGPFAALYIHDIVLGLWLLLLARTHWQEVQRLPTYLFQLLKQNKAARLLTTIVVVGWLTALATQTLPFWTVLFVARLAVYLGWGWLEYRDATLSAEWWQLGFLCAGLLIAVLGLLQYALLPDTRLLSILGWDDHYYRLISTQLDPNFTGLLLAITLFWWWETPFSWWQWLVHGLSKSHLRQLQKCTTLVVSAILLVALGLTFSRASWLSLVLGSLVMIKPKPNLRLVIMAVFFLVAIIVAAPKPTGEGTNLWRTSTIAARVATSNRWLTTLNSYQLIIGRGLFVPPAKELSVAAGVEADHANLPDNLVVLLISGLGAAGTFSLVYFGSTWLRFHQLNRLTAAVGAMVLTHSLFNNSLLQVFVLLFVLGTIIRARKVTA